jgi:photosystem II stability/assembly factor-like uncharacterized protein
MIKNISIVLCLMFTNQTAHSQEGWFVQYGNSYDDFYKIFMIDSVNGWVVSYDTMYQTTNSGFNWIARDLGRWGYNDIYFLSLNTGWIAGDTFILKTTNSGMNWEQQLSGFTQYAIFFVDENTGFTIANTQLCRRTTNSGNNWASFIIGSGSYSLFSIDFLNHDTGWIGGSNGILFKTTNCGVSWVQKETGANTRFYGLSFTSPDTGWAGGFNNFGDSKVHFTSTGGESWVVKYVDPVNQGVEDIFFTSAKEGWAVGWPGKIIHTTDAGNTWEFQNSGAGNIHLFSVYFVTSKTGWVVGEAGGANGKILKTTTGGVVAVQNNSNNHPVEFNLYQNYPNPFNNSTMIKFEISKSCFVILKIYDIIGREAKTLVNEDLSQGIYTKYLDAGSLSSGIYFYRLVAENYGMSKKMILIR